MYDFLIVGAGFYGSVMAHELKKVGKSVLVIDRRPHIGGNCYTKEVVGIQQHVYGPHLFGTNKEYIWEYINQFSKFEQYTHRVKVNYLGKIYSFPINLMTLYQLWGVSTPTDAKQIIEEKKIHCNPTNLREWVCSELGEEIFQIFFCGYSEKQWGKSCDLIPCSIGKRLPIRFNYDDHYHESKYTGIPVNGYTPIFERLLEGIEVKQDDFQELNWQTLAKKLIYSGSIDELFGYCYGELEYRSLNFETSILDMENYQGVAQMNFTSIDVPYTRIVEHKWISPKYNPQTIITKEYSCAWEKGKERYYPVANPELYKKYSDLTEDIIIGGRLGKNKYIQMDDTIAMALKDVKKALI